jgi:hypothetical protein
VEVFELNLTASLKPSAPISTIPETPVSEGMAGGFVDRDGEDTRVVGIGDRDWPNGDLDTAESGP